MSKAMRIAIASSVLFWIITFFIYLYNIGGETYFPKVADALAIVPALFAFGAALLVLINFKRNEEQWLMWLFIGLGLAFFTVGEISWAVYEIVLGIKSPFPSWADIFWILGYTPLLLALWLKMRSTQLQPELGPKLGLVFVLTVVFGLSMNYVIIPIALYAGIPILDRLLSLAYPVQDLIVITLTAWMVLPYGRGMLGRPWLYISSGFVAFAAADMVFSYLSIKDLYTSGNMIELLWLGGYILIGIGALSKLELIFSLRRDTETRELLSGISFHLNTTKPSKRQLV